MRHAAKTVLEPVLDGFFQALPDLTVDEAPTDIVASQYDAGIRFAERVDRDMIGVRVGPDLCFAVVATPA